MANVSRAVTVGAVMAVLGGCLSGTAQAAPAQTAAQAPAVGVDASVGAAKAAKKWAFALRTSKGKKLPTVKVKGGGASPKLVVGAAYRVTGKVPAGVLSRMSGKKIVLQHQPAKGGAWKSVKKIQVGKTGRFDVKFKVTKKLLHKRNYRVSASLKSKTRGLTATTATSSTTSATAVVQFLLEISNNTGDNLNVTFPTAQTSSNGYNSGTFPLNNGQTVSLVYTNPPAGSSVVWSVQKQNCFGPNCTTYRTSWNYTPSRGDTACSSSAPQFNSADSYTVDLKPQFGSGYDGYLNGPLAGPNAANSTCTFQLVEAFDNWIENNPVKGFIAIVIAVVIIAIIIFATVSTGGGDLAAVPEAAEFAEELYGDGWYETTLDDPAMSWTLDEGYVPAG